MDELARGLELSITGPQRDQAVERCRRQLREWNVVLPDIEPLVTDFGQNDFGSIGLIEFWLANEFQAGYCGKYLYLSDGQNCPMHRHRIKMETFFIMHGTARVEYDGRVHTLTPGSTLKIEAGKFHDITGVGPLLLLELSMPSRVADNFFLEPSIPIGENYHKTTS